MEVHSISNELEANKRIQQFAADLRALAGDDAIPLRWKSLTKKALSPPPKSRGAKIDAQRYTAIAADLILLSQESFDRQPDDPFKGITSIPLTAEVKRNLAAKHGVSESTVKRVEKLCSDLITNREVVEEPARTAILEGIAAAIASGMLDH